MFKRFFYFLYYFFIFYLLPHKSYFSGWRNLFFSEIKIINLFFFKIVVKNQRVMLLLNIPEEQKKDLQQKTVGNISIMKR